MNKTHLFSRNFETPVQVEALASATISPGMLVKLVSGEFAPHDGSGLGYVAKELTATFDGDGGLSTNYVAGETAQAYEPQPGDGYRMLVATDQTITKDTALESAGDGTLRVATTGEVVCYANEDAGTTDDVTGVSVKFI